MRCPKCNHEMKQYFGLVETGWDCVNKFCGNETHDLALDPNGNVVTPGADVSSKKANTYADNLHDSLRALAEALEKGMFYGNQGQPDELFLSPRALESYKDVTSIHIKDKGTQLGDYSNKIGAVLTLPEAYRVPEDGSRYYFKLTINGGGGSGASRIKIENDESSLHGNGD